MELSVIDNSGKKTYTEKLMKIHYVCQKCNKILAFCYLPEIEFSKLINTQTLCEDCKT